MKPTPLPIRILLGLISAFVLVSGGYGVWMSASLEAWFRIGFEGVLVLAGAIGVLTALGRFRTGPVWAMTCVAGATFVAALLANSTGGEGEATAMTPGAMVRSALRDTHTSIRLAAGVAALALGGLTLLLRSPGIAFKRLLIGLGLLAPVALAAGLWVAGPLASLVDGLHPVVQTVLALGAFFAAVFLASAGGHYLIRSLEAGVEGEAESGDAA